MNKSVRVCIVGGAGHVGLPLGICFAQVPNFRVDLLDMNAEAVASVMNKKMIFVENGAEAALEKLVGKSLFATTDKACLIEADHVIFVTGTPVHRATTAAMSPSSTTSFSNLVWP